MVRLLPRHICAGDVIDINGEAFRVSRITHCKPNGMPFHLIEASSVKNNTRVQLKLADSDYLAKIHVSTLDFKLISRDLDSITLEPCDFSTITVPSELIKFSAAILREPDADLAPGTKMIVEYHEGEAVSMRPALSVDD
jgi:translation elongation factor P/translation initiation factor 5A